MYYNTKISSLIASCVCQAQFATCIEGPLLTAQRLRIVIERYNALKELIFPGKCSLNKLHA